MAAKLVHIWSEITSRLFHGLSRFRKKTHVEVPALADTARRTTTTQLEYALIGFLVVDRRTGPHCPPTTAACSLLAPTQRPRKSDIQWRQKLRRRLGIWSIVLNGNSLRITDFLGVKNLRLDIVRRD